MSEGLTTEQIERMVQDADFSMCKCQCSPEVLDLCCHVKALAAEVERLRAELKAATEDRPHCNCPGCTVRL